MSDKKNEWYNHLESLAQHASGAWVPDCPYVDQAYLDAQLTLWTLRTYDLLESDTSPEQIVRTLKTWLNVQRSAQFRDVLALMDEALTRLTNQVTLSSYDSFKRSLSYKDVGGLLAPMKTQFQRWVSENDPNAFAKIMSFLAFPLRGNYPSPQLEDSALSNYLRDEAEMWDGVANPRINYYIRKWTKSYKDDDVLVGHGSGVTADAGNVTENKYLSLSSDLRLNYVVRRIGAEDLLGPGHLNRVSKTLFVPKSYKSFRTISAEPASLMWWQNHVLQQLNRAMESSPLRRHYNPEDQKMNREYAWLGSVDGSYATIDLSSASDLVSWSLVKQAFKGTPVLPWLFATRSDSTLLPDGRVVVLKKFAPMGSRLSFPVEVLIFSAIVASVLDEHNSHHDFLVYGDDIIVPTDMAAYVISALEQHGFRVNTRKSHYSSGTGPHYRESCGGEYLCGVDVTPLRVPRNFPGFSAMLTSDAFTSLIDLANTCYVSAPSIRVFIINKMLGLPKRFRPIFSSDGEVGLFSPTPSNWHLKSRWNEDFQQSEYQCGTPTVRSKSGLEGIRYIEYLRQTVRRSRLPEYPLVVNVGEHRAGMIRSTWRIP